MTTAEVPVLWNMVKDSLTSPTIAFLQYMGTSAEEVTGLPICYMLGKLVAFIEMGQGNRKPWKASTKVTYAHTIIAGIERIKNINIAKLPVAKCWLKKIHDEASREPSNQAPVMSLEEMENRILVHTPKSLIHEAKILLHLAWLTASRSIAALTGLAIVDVTPAGWRVSWQQHKTKSKIGIKDVILKPSGWTEFIKENISTFPKHVIPILPTETILMIDEIATKALDGRAMTIRRSAAQHMYETGTSREQIREITLHASDKTLSLYLATKPGKVSRRK